MATGPPSTDSTLDLARDVLDHVVIDVDGKPCGIVDDIALEPGYKGALKVSAILMGPGAARARLPAALRPFHRWLLGRRITAVPWRDVRRIGDHIEIARTAAHYGLDKPKSRWLRRPARNSRW
jgi:sporulation protein YlmC with PRC-barrel domain